MKQILIFFFIAVVLSFSPMESTASEGDEHPPFNAIEYLFKHVNDSHEWHFLSFGSKHVAVPLPIILYSKHSGWHFFLSDKLYIPKKQHQLFHIAHGGNNDGKIVELLPDGSYNVPLDLSLTKSVLGAIFVSLLLLIVIITAAKRSSKNPYASPKGIQNMVEPVVVFVRDNIAKSFAGSEYKRFLPYLLTVFFFVLLSNLFGLILPLGFNITGNIAVTLTLGAFTFVITLISGNRKYWLHIVNPDVPIFMKLPVPIMPLVELAGVIIKPMILMLRLFANMFAGHIIVTVLISLIFIMSALAGVIAGTLTSVISIFFSIFIVMLDILVSFIQTYIFTLLSAMYFGMATDKGHH